MDEKLIKDTDALKESGIRISELKADIAKAEQKIFDLNRLLSVKGQFAGVIESAKNNINALKKDIEQMESELSAIEKSI